MGEEKNGIFFFSHLRPACETGDSWLDDIIELFFFRMWSIKSHE
jgi:hypothetical protein